MSKNISPFENDFLFQNNSLPMSVINIRAEIIDINLKALDIFGYPKKEILKLTANDLIKDKDYELEIDRLNALFNKEINSYTIKRNYTNKSGENIPLNITVSLITDPVSKEKFFLGIFE